MTIESVNFICLNRNAKMNNLFGENVEDGKSEWVVGHTIPPIHERCMCGRHYSTAGWLQNGDKEKRRVEKRRLAVRGVGRGREELMVFS